VTFGDVGGYRHRDVGAPLGSELNFFSTAAWYYKDSAFQAIYDWDKKVAGGPSSPDLSFSLDELYMGSYALPQKPGAIAGFLGIQYVLLDDAALRWSAMRSEQTAYLPREGQRYFDKLAFRFNLDPQSEYLLMDGVSTFAHGHYDGNSILRLTWKDRVWLMQSDYVKLSAKYQNGVVITRDSIQEPPPPLSTLDYAAEFTWGGMTRTISHACNGTDWTRDIVWLKGKSFIVLDHIRANEAGNFRIEPRWRVVGNAKLKNNEIVSRQGDAQFTIRTAGEIPRSVYHESSSSKSDTQGSASSPLDVAVSVYYGPQRDSFISGKYLHDRHVDVCG
jgi:hypothetical protein